MKSKLMKPTMLALAGAVALAAAGSASAMSPPYAVCNFKGQTELTVPGLPTAQCWLTLTAKANCAGDMEIVAAGPVPGASASCSLLFVGGFPWTGMTPGLGTIFTPTTGSVAIQDGTPPEIPLIAGGAVTGVSVAPPGNTSFVQCDDSGNTVEVPNVVQVSGTNNFGGSATFNTVAPNHLQNLGCIF